MEIWYIYPTPYLNFIEIFSVPNFYHIIFILELKSDSHGILKIWIYLPLSFKSNVSRF